MDRNRKRIDYSYGSSRSFGTTSLVDGGLGDGTTSLVDGDLGNGTTLLVDGGLGNGTTLLVDGGLGNGGGRYKAKLKHWEWD